MFLDRATMVCLRQPNYGLLVGRPESTLIGGDVFPRLFFSLGVLLGKSPTDWRAVAVQKASALLPGDQ